MNRLILLLSVMLLLVASARAADPPDDVQFNRALKRTVSSAMELDFTRMLSHIVRRGADMGGNDGWFGPSESRYNWRWLSTRCGDKSRIALSDFGGPPELFA